MPRFDLNISILLREYPFLDRFDHAARLGFRAVEFWWPEGVDPDRIVERVRATGLEVVLINFDGGDLAAGARGLLNDPEHRDRMRANVPAAIELAQRVGCTRLNALAGHWRPGVDREAQLDLVRENLAWIAERAREGGITVMLEALNSWENGPYLFTGTRQTLDFLTSIGAPNLAYQYDIYHMQRMEGNVVATLRHHAGEMGHIQIADSPDRHQPGTGELNYPYILRAIDESPYRGWVGLEFHPLGAWQQSILQLLAPQ